MNNALLAEVIKEQCKIRNIPISKLLTDCDIRKSLIYDLEKRDWTPSGDILERLANYFDCSIDYLLGRTDRPEVNK